MKTFREFLAEKIDCPRVGKLIMFYNDTKILDRTVKTIARYTKRVKIFTCTELENLKPCLVEIRPNKPFDENEFTKKKYQAKLDLEVLITEIEAVLISDCKGN